MHLKFDNIQAYILLKYCNFNFLKFCVIGFPFKLTKIIYSDHEFRFYSN